MNAIDVTRSEMIKEHTPLMRGLVSDFLRKEPQFRHLRQDIESSTMIKLIRTVDGFISGHVHNFKGYLRLSIRSGIWDAVRSENVIQNPRYCSPRRTFVDDHVHYELPPGELTSEDCLALACRCASDRTIVSMLINRKRLRTIAKTIGQTELEVQEQAGQILRRYKIIYHARTKT